jgi:dTDP-4-amino-4,6-dideoxygalactose transaminase
MALEDYLGTQYLLATNCCTSALQLALHLVRDHECPDSEVVTTPFTCIAVASAIQHAGHKIVWSDIHPYTYNLDLDALSTRLTEKTRAVVVPHFCGDPVDLNHLYNVLRRHYNITGNVVWVIEDCASSFGSMYKDEKIGACHKDINHPHEHSIKCFSFQATKALTTGDGGAIVLPNKWIYERAKRLRWYGVSREEDRYNQNVQELGYKFHMNDVAASIGLDCLESIEETVSRQIENRDFYYDNLKRLGPIKQPERVSACGQFPLRIKNRSQFQQFMAERGVEVRQPHTRLDKHLCLPCGNRLSVLEECCEEVVCIPSGWWVSDEDRDHIVKSVGEWHG